MTVDTFKREITEATKNYDRYVICLQKTPDEFEASLTSLMQKAIKAFENRANGMRHGIALDKEVTVILSQSDDAGRPLCGIYFNLYSAYLVKSKSEKIDGLGISFTDAPDKKKSRQS